MSTEALIHVGFPKTGTKTLQSQFFPHHPDVDYLGAPYDDAGVRDFISYIRDSQEASYRRDIAQKKFEAAILPLHSDGKIFAISDEDLTSYEFVDRLTMVQRLQELFGSVKIVVSVRHQLSQLESYYFQALRWYLRPGGIIIPFKNFIADTLPMPRVSPVHNVLYFDLCRAYEELVGSDSLKIVVFEDFKSDNSKTLHEICLFAGISGMSASISPVTAENVRATGPYMLYKKIRAVIAPSVAISRFIPAPITRKLRQIINNGAPASVTWDKETKNELWNFFKEDNRKLAARFNLDLERHNYPL
jgi:hypothetical protein